MPMMCLPLLVALAMPLSGELSNPPRGPMERTEPQVHEALFEVTLHVVAGRNRDRSMDLPRMELSNTQIMMPLLTRGPYSTIDINQATMRLWLQNREVEGLSKRTKLDPEGLLGGALLIAPIERFQGTLLRWNLTIPIQVWSSKLNDRAAAELRWPAEWPEAVHIALQPQAYIESDDPVFAKAVETATENRLRLMPPLIAAKELIRYAITKVQISERGTELGGVREIKGMKITGAKYAGEKGMGTPHDLVCVCVALLRAAGIPSRPVIGIFKHPLTEQLELVSWAELYLHGAGWIPFDPVQMQRNGVFGRNLIDPWPDFGTLPLHNQRIPLAHHFIPPREAEVSVWPAIWGWHPPAAKNVEIGQTIRIDTRFIRTGTDEPR